MAIDYIKNDQGSSIGATQKTKAIFLDTRKTLVNPFIVMRAIPDSSEALETGGGIYRFLELLGLSGATRRTAAKNNNTVSYMNLGANESILTVSQPLELTDGQVIAMTPSDIVQEDGINFSPVATAQAVKTLIQGEIDTDFIAIDGNINTNVVEWVNGATGLEKIKAIRTAISKYFDISTDNGWSPEAVAYFSSNKKGSFTSAELSVNIHPNLMKEISEAFQDSGLTTGDMAYREWVSGEVPVINGTPIVQTNQVPMDEVWIGIKGVSIATPDEMVMSTVLVASIDPTGNNLLYGKHYYDSKLLFESLFTKVVEGAVIPPTFTTFEKRSKEELVNFLSGKLKKVDPKNPNKVYSNEELNSFKKSTLVGFAKNINAKNNLKIKKSI